MFGTGLGSRPERVNQIAIGRDVLQPVEGDASALIVAMGEIVLLARGGVGPERMNEIVVARDVGQRVECHLG